MLRSVVGFSRLDLFCGRQARFIGRKETNENIPAWFILGCGVISVRAVVDFQGKFEYDLS
jgi:hypothetical protein